MDTIERNAFEKLFDALHHRGYETLSAVKNIIPDFSIEKSALTEGKGRLMKSRRDFITVAEVIPNFAAEQNLG